MSPQAKAKRKKYNKLYRETHREKAAAYMREWIARNRAAYNEYQRVWIAKRRAELKANLECAE